MRHRAEPDAVADGRGRRRLRLGVGAAIVLLLGAFVVAVVGSAFAQQGSKTAVPAATEAATSPAPVTADAEELFVHVSGAVVTPGLVTLPAGARVVDAVAAAGGLTADADPAAVNLARPISDGEQLIVPREGEAPPPGSGAAPGAAAGAAGVVNLNTAGQNELETLPRIGPALAQRILDWRAANGRFTDPADLLQVAGIGQKIFDGLKDRVAV
jgi:competence protein ComEA